MRNKKGFTLAELMVVVAIIGVLVAVSVPIFSSQLEKSREATDLANVRSAYAQVMTEAISKDGLPDPVAVFLKQTQDDWQTKRPITIGGVTFNDTESDNWKGTPKGKGMCRVSYEKDRGVIFNWEGGYAGDASASITKFLNYDTLSKTENMNTNKAYYSSQDLRIGTKTVLVRIYYKDSPAFKDAFDKWHRKPCGFKDSPVYLIQNDQSEPVGGYKDGFAYYTYGEDHKINSLIYVSPTNVYESKDEGRTWYDITHSSSETTAP